jgi:putative ABC transport system permease protein
MLSALPGSILGVLLEFGLFTPAVHGGGLPPVSWLVATMIGLLIAMAALSVVPAQLDTRQQMAEVLASEAA